MELPSATARTSTASSAVAEVAVQAELGVGAVARPYTHLDDRGGAEEGEWVASEIKQ